MGKCLMVIHPEQFSLFTRNLAQEFLALAIFIIFHNLMEN